MKSITLILAAAWLSVWSANAQTNDYNNRKSGVTIAIGASANYYYGPGDRNFDKFEDNRLNYQLNGMLGLTIARDNNDHRTMLAGFGSFGMNSASTMDHIFADQGYVAIPGNQNSSNNFYQLEGGLLIAEVFRISTGVGQQVFNKQVIGSENGIDLEATSLKYNSTTVGFNFNVSAVSIILNCNFEYGQDYKKTVIVPSAGLMFHF